MSKKFNLFITFQLNVLEKALMSKMQSGKISMFYNIALIPFYLNYIIKD